MTSTIAAFTFTSAFSIGANLIYLKIKNQKSIPIKSGSKINPDQIGIKNTVQNSKQDSGVVALSVVEGLLPRMTSFWSKIQNRLQISDFGFRIFLGGILTALLLTFAGNLHTIYAFFKPYVNENPVPFWQLPFSPETFPNSYWYPNATRFIHNTIHEFPLYSFVVSDLHGHVLDIPFVLLTIATSSAFLKFCGLPTGTLEFNLFNKSI